MLTKTECVKNENDTDSMMEKDKPQNNVDNIHKSSTSSSGPKSQFFSNLEGARQSLASRVSILQQRLP